MKYFAIIIVLAVITFGGCTIKPPDVIVTSEKTVLERQLLGTDDRITEDPLSVTAVWSRDFAFEPAVFTQGEQQTELGEIAGRKLIIAQIRRQTLKEHLDQLKRNGILGEKNNGLLAIMPDSGGQFDEIENLVAAENSDRAVIWEFYAVSSGADPITEVSTIRKDFASIMTKTSPTGTWIEDDNGNWTRK